MITEDYVSFETAKLLKEKGFNEECEYFYDEYDEDEYVICSNGGSAYNDAKHPTYYSMPTLQMAMKWLREVHGIFICIEFDAPTFVADIYRMDEIDEYGCAKHIPPTIANCQTYEKAVEAAIKYVLENLI